MSVISGVPQVTDESLTSILEADPGVLILTRSDCGHCASYQTEITALLECGRLAGVALGKVVLDRPGALRFKRENQWLAGVGFLPYTLIYSNGRCIHRFAASRGTYLVERIEDLQSSARPNLA